MSYAADARGSLLDFSIGPGLRAGAAPVVTAWEPAPGALSSWYADLANYVRLRREVREARRLPMREFARHMRWQADEERESSKVPAFVEVATELGRVRHPYVGLRARDCGGVYYVPVTCDDVLCPECMKRKSAAEARRWLPVLQAMYSPKLLTLTVKNTATAQEGRDELQSSLRRFSELSLGPRNMPGLMVDALAFAAESPDAEQRARFVSELGQFEKRIERMRRKSARPIRMRHLLGKGWRDIDITCSDSTGWHWHAHCCLDMKYIPQPFLVAAWRRATRGTSQVVDVRRIGKTEKDINEVCKYVCKSWELLDERARDELRNALYGMQKVKAIGGAKPVDEPHVCPCCGASECTAARMSGELQVLTTFDTPDGRRAALLDVAGVPTVVVEFKPGFWREEPGTLLDVGALAQQGDTLLSGAGPPGAGPPGVSGGSDGGKDVVW